MIFNKPSVKITIEGIIITTIVYGYHQKDLIQNTLSSSVWLIQVQRQTIHTLTDVCVKTGVS